MTTSKENSAGPATSTGAASPQPNDTRRQTGMGNEAPAANTASTDDTGPGRPAAEEKAAKQKPGEIGGPKGPEPTRYGDWEVGGRCTDF